MIGRLRNAAAALAPDQRLAGALALGLFLTMFLPWYSRTAVGVDREGRPVQADDALNAFQVFSFVEAAVLLVAAAVLFLLFQRGERKAFHLPGGDGMVITAAGLWVCLLVFWRQFDQPEIDPGPGLAVDTGVSWGIFITFLVAAALAFAGWRIRAAHLVEPPLPGEAPTRAVPADQAPTRVDRHRPEIDGGEQLSFDEHD